MKTKISLILASLAMAFSVGAGVAATNKVISNADAAIDITDYTDCNAKHQANNASGLLAALRTITSPGSSGGYDALWTTYKKAYVRADGKLFDYYSSITNYVPGGSAQGASYSKEGDAYNREHSIPKSWWGGSTSNQGADPYIVVPTDGYVNNGRSNYSFGKVKTATKTYSNSKLGTGDSTYISGTVFEPDDSVKGDFARINFYAIAKYSGSYGWTSGDGSKVFSGSSSTNFGLTTAAVKLFSYWSNLDPVSDWERSVNEKVAAIQKNRNPFIDHPEYANTLWGKVSGYTQYTASSSSSLVISEDTLSLAPSGSETLTATANGGETIHWTTSDSSIVSLSASTGNSVTVTAGFSEGTATITASITVNSSTISQTCVVTVSEGGGSVDPEGTYSIVPSDFTNGYDSVTANVETASGLSLTAFYAGNVSSKIQFHKGNGYIFNNTALNLDTITIQNVTNSLKVYAGSTSNPSTTEITPSNGVYDLSGYPFFKIICDTGSYATCEKIVVTTGAETGDAVLTGITLDTTATQTTFNVGDEFNYDGLVVSASYDNGAVSIINPDEVSAPDMSTTGTKTVTVSYSENNVTKTATYQITVEESGSSEIVWTKTSFSEGSGTIEQCTVNSHSGYKLGGKSAGASVTIEVPSGTTALKFYAAGWNGSSNTTTLTITGATCSQSPVALTADSGISNSTPFTTSGDNETFLIQLSLSNISSSTTITIASNKRCCVWNDVYYGTSGSAPASKTLTSIELDTSSVQSVFAVRDTFTYDGLIVTAHYSDNTSEAVEPTSVTAPDMTTVGTKTVAVRYQTQTATYSVEVVARLLYSITLDTTNVKTEFDLNETFSYSGLIVTALYSDATSEVITTGYTVSSPTMTTRGTKAVTVTYSGKTATYNIVVGGGHVNYLQPIYSMSSGAEIDVYGYYVGFLDGTGPVIMDGEYGVVCFNKSADVSGYTINETILHVTGSLTIYKGLYEVGSPSISVASGTFEEPDKPIVYTTVGGETQEKEARLTTLTGVPSIPSGTTYGDFSNDPGTKDIVMNFAVGSNTIQVFYKSKAQTADTDVYYKMKTAVQNSETVTIKGFTGWFNTFQIQMNGLIEASDDFKAADFAQLLLDKTDEVCEDWTEGINNHDRLALVWSNLINPTEPNGHSYPFLAASEKLILAQSGSSETGTVIEQAIARYEYICGRYGLTQFIEGRDPIPVFGQRINTPIVFNESSMPVTITVIIGVVGLTALGGYIFIRKRKEI